MPSSLGNLHQLNPSHSQLLDQEAEESLLPRPPGRSPRLHTPCSDSSNGHVGLLSIHASQGVCSLYLVSLCDSSALCVAAGCSSHYWVFHFVNMPRFCKSILLLMRCRWLLDFVVRDLRETGKGPPLPVIHLSFLKCLLPGRLLCRHHSHPTVLSQGSSQRGLHKVVIDSLTLTHQGPFIPAEGRGEVTGAHFVAFIIVCLSHDVFTTP